jgi:hypothetical protein
MLANNRNKILQHVINDPSTEVERAEATRELNATDRSKSPSPRRGRNLFTPGHS